MNHSIALEQGRIHAESQGEGESVLFLHADFVDGRMWDGVRDLLTDYRTFAFDKLGYGRSDAANGPVSRRRELVGVVEALPLAKFHLVGCSNGGSQALDFTLENPEKVLSLTLVNAAPSGWQLEGQPPAPLLAMIDAVQRGDLAAASELQLQIWFDGCRERLPRLEAARTKAAEMNRIFVERGTFFSAPPTDLLDPPALKRLAEVKAPVLVIDGLSDWPENRRASRWLAEGIPGAKRVEVEGAHVPPLEDPETFARLWKSFRLNISPGGDAFRELL